MGRMTEKKAEKPFAVSSHDVHLDSDYIQWIHSVKERFRNAQIKTAVKINYEQLYFNWQMGRDLAVRRMEEKWGSGIVEQISLDLKNEFPEVKGFSTTNLWYMKKWYLFYSHYIENGKLHQLIGETEKQMSAMQSRLRQSGPDWKEAKLQQDIGGTKTLRRQQSCWRRSLCKDLWWRFFTVS